MNCYPFIKAERAQRRNVKRACELMKFARSACYAARDGRPSQRAWQCPPTQRAATWRATPDRSSTTFGCPRLARRGVPRKCHWGHIVCGA